MTVYTDSARADLREIATYYSRVNRDYARRIIDAIRKQCRKLNTFPGTGRMRPELADGLRSVVVKPFLVFYREVEEGVAIVRIIDGRRHITPAMFDD